MSDFKPGLEGVVAVETEIAEPDREGGALRYRGVDIEELVGSVPFEQVWGLLVDEAPEPGLPPAEEFQAQNLTGDAPADLQTQTAWLGGHWRLQKLIDISDEQAKEDLRRVSATMVSIAAQSARLADGQTTPVPRETIEQGETTAERFLLEWRGEADPKHVQALDTYWICTAEHGLNASTFTARIVASTGGDCGACLSSAVGALSGPLHGGAPARVLPMLDAAAQASSLEEYVTGLLDRGERLMGFGHRVYRVRDPRADVLKATASALRGGGNRIRFAEAVEAEALTLLAQHKPGRPLDTNVEFYTALVLEALAIPRDSFTNVFAVGRVAGWTAHILEQESIGRLIRPQSRYVGPEPRRPQAA
jgi:citrate synthase